jgi:biopolymer transport protein ExbD
MRDRRSVPGLNTASVADISFTLLILFLVVTSIDTEKGIRRRLPPNVPDKQIKKEQEVAARNVMRIRLLSDNTLTIDGESAAFSEIKTRVMRFVENPSNSENLPEKVMSNIPLIGYLPVTEKHVIQLTAERSADYQSWFTVQNEIVSAYTQLRDDFTCRHFGQHYAACTDRQKEAARACYPQRVSEEYLRRKGGDL